MMGFEGICDQESCNCCVYVDMDTEKMDLSDLISLDTDSTTDDFTKSLPEDLQIPLDADDLSFFNPNSHDDLLHDWSDSSDSGVSGLTATGNSSPTLQIKNEPLSPASIISTDSNDSGAPQIQDYIYTIDSLPEEETQGTPPHTPSSVVNVQNIQTGSTFSFVSTKHESQDIKPTVIVNPVITSQRHGGTSIVNIHSILNSKVRIKPKPEKGTAEVTPTSAPTKCATKPKVQENHKSNSKSLVLSAEEFAKLTSQGVLRFQPPAQNETVISEPKVVPSPASSLSHQSSVMPLSPPIVTSSNPASLLTSHHVSNQSLIQDSDLKMMKRQQRMIKNRESASLSRKRKKEYLTTLEVRLQESFAENHRLKEENLALKRKMESLQNENASLQKTFGFSPAKKTCLLGLILMLSLNLAPWSLLVSREDSAKIQLPDQKPFVHKGRQLMSTEERQEPDGWLSNSDIDKLHNFLIEYTDNQTESAPLMCPTYFNKTESIRLAEQLAGWMSRHEEEKKKVHKKQQRQKRKQLRPISTLRAAMKGDVRVMDQRHLRSIEAQYQVQLYGGADNGRDFLKAIHRKNDTFYVLSFDTEYYLIPAVAHNKTTRPKMSLVMPAVALNDSMTPPAGRVGMMQIDCEVINTKLIHVQKSAIPKDVRLRNSSFTDTGEKENYYP